MKNHHFLFLFFVLFFLESSALSNYKNSKKSDSLGYFYKLAIKPNNPQDFSKALDFFLKHKAECLSNNNVEGAVYDLRLLTIIQYESGFLHDAEAISIEALKLLNDLSNAKIKNNSKIGLYNQLGRIKDDLKDYEASVKYYDKAYRLSSDFSQKASILNNKALVYVKQDNFTEAIKYLEQAYSIAKESESMKSIATALDNLGFISSKLNKPKGLEYMLEALDYRIENELIKGQFASYNHLAQYYSSNNDMVQSNSYLAKASQVAEIIGSDSYKLEILKQKIKFSSDSIAKSYLELKEFEDSRKLLIENKYAARKYNYERQEYLAKQNQKDKHIFQIILLATIIIGLLGYFLIKTRHNKQKLQEVYDTEFKLSKRIHDEVANDIYQAMAQVDTGVPKEKVMSFLDNIYLKTRDISRENRLISENEDFSESIRDLISSYSSNSVNLISKGIDEVDWDKISTLKQVTVFRIIQELLTNMKKHSEANLVVLIFSYKNNKIHISYTDNGVGADINIKNGLANTENRIKSIGGKIIFDTQPNKGFKASLII